MSEIMDDYDAGVRVGYAKAITLIRHLQKGCAYPSIEWAKLEKAMELIAENIETNNENNR